MTCRPFTAFVILTGVLTPSATARDPESDRPGPKPAERRRLYERVEEDVDRGTGRIEDEQTYEIRRLQDARDERLGRIKPQRESKEFQEEYDRRRQIELRDKRQAATPPRLADAGIVVESNVSAVGSPLVRFVEEQGKLLETSRERYQADLKAAEVTRDEAIRAAGDSFAEKARAVRRFEDRRGELTRGYQTYRRKILGTK